MAFGKSGRVNMDGSDDPFYRYTMPTLQVKVEGTTKMIKTQLMNIENVAQAVGRPPSYLVTYFGQELNSNSKWDAKEGKAYVTGNQDPKAMQDLVFKFIKKFVSCGACGNPETQITMGGGKKSKEIILNCISCGSKTKVDMVERFSKYIVQHPPEEGLGKGSADANVGASGKKDKKLSRKDKDGDGSDEGGDDAEENDENETEAATKTKDGSVIVRDKNMGSLAALADEEQAEKKKKEKKEKKEKKQKKEKSSKSKKKKGEESDDDDDWSMDVSDEAVKARQAALCAGMEKVVAKAEALGVTTEEHLN